MYPRMALQLNTSPRSYGFYKKFSSGPRPGCAPRMRRQCHSVLTHFPRSVLNWKVTCARRVNLVARHSGRLPLDSVGTTTKDTKITKMEFDELSNRMIGCAIAVHWHVGPELRDGNERFLL